ncbi:MAG: hypothetical protein Q8Q08_01145 [Candidatus Omnitrophota bacterium]|nr:hypothetical protein [Candidatus Omnitrophota bacterium]MDZ4241280.1 hypothetical protein [Candidatus Omnitrophota bacterium]
MTRKFFQNMAVSVAAALICLAMFEAGARLLIKPSDKCYGVLLGNELPPFKIDIGDLTLPDFNAWQGLSANGGAVTRGDLGGLMEEDPALGYVPQKNAVSRAGWWQSNNFGARSRLDTPKEIPPGLKRVIILGESFTNGSRIRQEEAWPSVLNGKSKHVEFLNFGVDGYSMAQCLLRYEGLKSRLDHDVVILAFVPQPDLWREVNVLRQLGGWRNCPVVPRFVLGDGGLKLIRSPYASYEALKNEDVSGPRSVLREHLRKYDRLYFPAKYESPPLIGGLISYKLLARAVYLWQEKSLNSHLMDERSEAMRISREIFGAMGRDAEQRGKKFVLVLLPSKQDVDAYRSDRLVRRQYDALAASLKRQGIFCIDLMPDLSRVSPSQFDTGYDGGHYGPVVNKVISEMVWRRLRDAGVI